LNADRAPQLKAIVMLLRMNAWLITWEGTGTCVSPANKIVAIVSSRRSSSFIEDLVDLLYCRSTDSAYYAARGMNTKRQRRREFLATYSVNGRIFWGRNPKLFARRVSDLKVVRNEAKGIETVTWVDPPYLKIEPPDYLPVVADPARPCRVVRPVHLPLSRDLHVNRHAT
jgi:hypothetical protein